MSKRFPSYSITLRSEGAGLRTGQWHHVAVVYEGSEGKDSMRAKAAWTRLFVNGREYATRVLHDDAQSGANFVGSVPLGHTTIAPMAVTSRGGLTKLPFGSAL